MNLIYSCDECGAEFLLRHLKIHQFVTAVHLVNGLVLSCPNNDCKNESFHIYIKD